MAWVSTFRVEPPCNQTIGLRFGNSMFHGYRSKWTGNYFMLVPGGGEEAIADAPMWWATDPEKIKLNDESQEPLPEKPNVNLRRSKKPQQVSFNFG